MSAYRLKIEATFISETPKAWYLDCEGGKEWFAKIHCHFDPKTETLEAPKWLLEQKFPETKF